MAGPFGFGFGGQRSAIAVSLSEKTGRVAEDVFPAATSVIPNQSTGKIQAKHIIFPVAVTVTVRYWDIALDAQIGSTRTAGPGTDLTVTANTVSDGSEGVRAEYTCTTSVSGYKAVTGWTKLFEVEFDGASGDGASETPEQPIV